MNALTRSSKHYSRPDLIRKIKRFEDSLLKMNIYVVVAWVPAHDKIEANEKVDRYV